MDPKEAIIMAALVGEGESITDTTAALRVARRYRESEPLMATDLALTWGGLSPEQATAEGFRYVESLTEDIEEDREYSLRLTAEWGQRHLPPPTGNVTPQDVLWGNGADFEENRTRARERGPFVLVSGSPGGYSALIQTPAGVCEDGSAMAAQYDASGHLQNAARNINTIVPMVLGRLLREDGVDIEEFLELQEDALVAEAARRGIGIDPKTGRYPWEI